MAIVDKIKAVAEEKGVTVGKVTLAWLMAQWEYVIPIPGTRRISALEENVEAMKVQLTEDEIKEITPSNDPSVSSPLSKDDSSTTTIRAWRRYQHKGPF